MDIYWSSYESKFGKSEGTEIREKLYSDSFNEKDLKKLLDNAKEFEKSLLIADRLVKKIELMVNEVDRRESYRLDALNDLKQSLNRGFSLSDSQDCKEESIEEYSTRLIDLEENFDEKMKQRIKYHR